MRTEKPEPDLDMLAEMGYEKRDVNMRAIGTATKWFFGFFFFSLVAAAGTYYFMVLRGQGPQDKLASSRMPAPPNPIVQSNVSVRTDMMKLRQREAAILSTPGWANPQRTRVRIPIERAIDLLAERGLPKTGTFPANPRGAGGPGMGNGEPGTGGTGKVGGGQGPAGNASVPRSPSPVPPADGPARAAVPNPPGNGR